MLRSPRNSPVVLPDWLGIAAVSVLGLVTAALVIVAVRHASSTPTQATTSGTSDIIAATPTADAEPRSAVLIGDSYAAGRGSTDYNGFIDAIAKKLNWTYTNVAVGSAGFDVKLDQTVSTAQAQCGAKYCNSFPEQIEAAKSVRPDVVMVSGGRANYDDSTATLAQIIPLFFTKLRAAFPDQKIYVVSPMWDSSAPPASLTEISTLMESSTKRIGGTFLNVGQPLRGHPSYLVPGTLLPNDTGYAAIARAVETKLSGSR